MKNFRTEIQVGPAPQKISYKSSITSIGSCFAEEIGWYLSQRKLRVDQNPFGVIYNPISVLREIEFLMKPTSFDESELVHHDGMWHSFCHHGQYSHPDQAICMQRIRDRLDYSSQCLQRADWLMVTFGTAWIYNYLKDGGIVANCHKIPSTEFMRSLLDVDLISTTWYDMLGRLFDFNPDLKILLTVSPVRHLKDGLEGNQISKSMLRLACQELLIEFPENVFYFPSYEIMMDDLRDYRFYKDDMLHPNEQAIEYIWEHFRDSYLDEKSIEAMAIVEEINQSLNHRPLHPHRPQHREFLQRLLTRIDTADAKYSFLALDSERSVVLEELDRLAVGDPR